MEFEKLHNFKVLDFHFNKLNKLTLKIPYLPEMITN